MARCTLQKITSGVGVKSFSCRSGSDTETALQVPNSWQSASHDYIAETAILAEIF
jgi:hypothetical protein